MIPETLTWIDILPALPLARGVPVRHNGDPKTVCDSTGCYAWLDDAPSDGYGRDRGLGANHEDDCIVDLDDPGGFGYALRFLMTHTRAVTAAESHVRSLTRRWLESRTTDADRLALARAIAEVSR